MEVGDILDIRYPDSSFEAYISMGVVEHFEDGPVPALKEAYRVLKPNGLIFVSTPTVNVIRKLIRRPIRNAINAFPGLLTTLRSGWGKSKRGAILAAAGAIAGSILPERIKRFASKKRKQVLPFYGVQVFEGGVRGFLEAIWLRDNRNSTS